MLFLHFGKGLTMGQFLSPLTNKRIDKYGGSLENRARFPIIIIDRIRQRVGRELLIKVRVGGAEFEPGGLVLEETIELVKLIQDLYEAEKILSDEKADVVTIARGFVEDPDLAQKSYQRQGERIRVSRF